MDPPPPPGGLNNVERTYHVAATFSIKDVLYGMLGPDLLGLTVALWNIVGR